MLSSWSAALPHDENVLAFQHSAREVVEIDLLGAGPHLVALLLEPGPQRRHGRGGQLPELLARFSLDAPFPALQVEVERAVEQRTDVFLVRPLPGVRVLHVRSAGPRMRLRPVVGRPRSEREPAARATHARPLGCGALVVGSEDRTEGGGHCIELRVAVRQLLAVALVEPDREALLLRRAARLRELVGGDVDADDVRAGPRRPKRNAARPAGDVENAY